MEIRFNTINNDVEEVLETIDKQNRKIFVETAILHYIKFLEANPDATDIIYASRKSKKDIKDIEVKPKKIGKDKIINKKIKEEDKPIAKDNSGLAIQGWD